MDKAKQSQTDQEVRVNDVSPNLIVVLIGVAALSGLLAVFQWMELIVAQRGGVLSCSINETLNCAAVWNAPLAKSIHELTYVPVAGWGLVWSLGALWSALRLNLAALSSSLTESKIASVRLFAAMGILASCVLAAVSFSVGAVCITCIATYWLVLTYGVCAYLLPGRLFQFSTNVIVPTGLRALGVVFVVYLLVLYPGTKTPTKSALSLDRVITKRPESEKTKATEFKKRPNPPRPPNPPNSPNSPRPSAQKRSNQASSVPRTVEELLSSFPPEGLQAFGNAMARIRSRKPLDVSKWPTRFRKGEASAAVKLVEFTDIKCGHCARLVMELKEIERLVKPGSLSIEPRQFPLDYECNKTMEPKMTDGSGVRCAAAKALICLEGQQSYWTAQIEMFKKGASLKKDEVIAIASDAAADKSALTACMSSDVTQAKLDADIAYATAYHLHGTPLVLLNGREVDPIGALLFAIVLAEGNLQADAFKRLPPPHPDALHDSHAGHGH